MIWLPIAMLLCCFVDIAAEMSRDHRAGRRKHFDNRKETHG